MGRPFPCIEGCGRYTGHHSGVCKYCRYMKYRKVGRGFRMNLSANNNQMKRRLKQ